jgi:hypothetical protein
MLPSERLRVPILHVQSSYVVSRTKEFFVTILHPVPKFCRPSFRENKPKTLVFQSLITSVLGLFSRKAGSINSGTGVEKGNQSNLLSV